tara:strand:+ start:139 stop:522 length:384 start_codon:yes stop_codon:yes gene_type:complete
MAFPTNPIYKLIKEPIRNEIIALQKYRDTTLLSIPLDEENTDYQEYLEWAKTNTAEAPDALTWDDIRAKRDGILQSTDWTMTTGASVDQAQWAAYRQVIRDIPQTYKDKTPDDVVWPTQPSTAGPNS